VPIQAISFTTISKKSTANTWRGEKMSRKEIIISFRGLSS